MDKKPRKLVYKQAGAQLQRIGDLFIASLLHHRPPGQNIYQFMEQMFCVTERSITQCEVTRDMRIGKKELWPGHRLFVRHDTTKPDLFELEVVHDSGPVLALSRAEWLAVRGNMRVIDKNTDGLAVLFGARA